MAQADFLKKRAEVFYENGREQIEKQHFFLAAFNFEQAAQLYLKYYLFLKIKDFPKVHELDKLLEELAKAYNQKSEIEKFLEKNASVIGDLNQAYITSRYLPVEFSFYGVEEMKKFVEKLIKLLKKICQ